MGLLASQPMLVTDLAWLEQVESTNAQLLTELAQNAAGAWSIRIASKQLSGRGRQGRSWESPMGSIPISIAIRLSEFKPAPTWLSMLTAVALKNSLQKYLTEPIQLKWPNDGLISSGKFAGILVERDADFAVIGVGINFFAAPKIQSATQLGITDYVPALANFLIELHRLIEDCSEMTDAQVQKLIAPAISTIGQQVEVQLTTGEQITGIATGITETGALMVTTKHGLVEVISGDVIHLRAANASKN